MDSAADGLLALSNTAAAIADNDDILADDRSSSLSELEDAPENLDLEINNEQNTFEGDSEAETEKLEESPDKLQKRGFQISPSKLAQSTIADERPEIEALTNSDVSSPMTPVEDSDVEDEPSDNEDPSALNVLSQLASSKRKRLSDTLEIDNANRIRRRRTGSVESEDEKSDAESDEAGAVQSREATIEPDELEDGAESDKDEEQAEAETGQEQADTSDTSKSKKVVHPTRSRPRRGKEAAETDTQDADDDNEAVEASDEEAEIDDAEAAAKSEEEQARRAAAMEALTALERHFATLRDKLYDERIAQINTELAQLAEPEPIHPELLRQIECVNRYRDEKMDTEQNLLVFKVGSLKTKSVAERSQINSAYFQTIRDVREQHLERMSEHFYRIQRERFKSSSVRPIYTVPFPEKRPQQITQQTAYNKEVSILSGVAKYVGFPAAPDLPSVINKEMDTDMDKMGIHMVPSRLNRPNPRHLSSSFNAALSAPAAGEQFLEQTPWANPNHPVHRLSRQASNRSHVPDTYQTPTTQQKVFDSTNTAGSASTIVENPSAPASSTLNTPHDPSTTQPKYEVQSNGNIQSYRQQSSSPTETRRILSSLQSGNLARPASQPRNMPGSSPLQDRVALDPLRRTGSAQPDGHQTAINVGAGIGRFGLS